MFGTFSVTNDYEKHQNSKIYIQFFTETDGLNSYFLLQIIERDGLLEMSNEILFFKT